MSAGHWIVVVADVLFLALTVASCIANREDWEGAYDIVIFIVVLMLFNIAAIAIR